MNDTFGLKTYPPAREMPVHQDGASKISMLLSGELYEESGAVQVKARGGFLAVKGAGNRHRTLFGSQPTVLFSFPVAEVAAVIREDMWCWTGHPEVVALGFTALEAHQCGDLNRYRSGLCDLLVSFDRAATSEKYPPPWLQDIRQRIDDEPHRSIDVSRLARKIGCHPVYLARAFRQHFGTSLTCYQQKRRIQEAMAQLAIGRHITHVALDTGFYDQSHFSRHFKKALGIAPGQWQRQHGLYWNNTSVQSKP